MAVVLPSYNPPAGWSQRLMPWAEALAAAVPALDWSFVLVDDGSTASPAEEARRLRERVSNLRWIAYQPNRGKGYALRTGFGACAEADYFVFTDIDLPYTEASLLAVVAALTEGRADVAVGVRDATYYAQIPWRRRVLSQLLRRLLALLLRLPVDDTQCGLKGFNRAGWVVFQRTRINEFLFDVEFLRLAGRDPKLRVLAVPVQLRPDVELSSIGAGVMLRELVNLVRIWWRT